MRSFLLNTIAENIFSLVNKTWKILEFLPPLILAPNEFSANMSYPATDPIYFRDTFLFEHDAIILGVEESKVKDCRVSVILDSTIFHPQGGGQPSDQGVISSSNFILQILHVN